MRLYIHWPFCISRCAYCDFNSRLADRRTMSRYREAMNREAHFWSCLIDDSERELESVYLGGGTPSTLDGREVGHMLKELTRGFKICADAEVSIEINPATWSYDDFSEAKAGGFNRFSIGVQSLDDDVLRILGRSHSASQASRAVGHALRVGGASVGVDILYGLPLGGIDALEKTLEEVLSWRPEHLRRLRGTGREMPTDDEVADQYLMMRERLQRAGYMQYEVSNYCLPGRHSRHNMAYWKREDYLGIGAGAHSKLCKCRLFNSPSLLRYMGSIRQGLLPVEYCELLAAEEELMEEIMLGLRTREGIPSYLLQDNDIGVRYMEDLGLLEKRGERFNLTGRGMLLSNAVIAELTP
jgi:oxygen-independent coproporphyrinogen-3 oxidase